MEFETVINRSLAEYNDEPQTVRLDQARRRNSHQLDRPTCSFRWVSSLEIGFWGRYCRNILKNNVEQSVKPTSDYAGVL